MTDFYAATVPNEGIFGVGKTEGEAIGKAVEFFATSDLPITKGEITVQKIDEDLYNYILSEYGGVVPAEEHDKRWAKIQEYRKLQQRLIAEAVLGDPARNIGRHL